MSTRVDNLAQRFLETEEAKKRARELQIKLQQEEKDRKRGKHTLTIYLSNKNGLFLGKFDPQTMLSKELNKIIKITSRVELSQKKIKELTDDNNKNEKLYKLILNLSENTINRILNRDSKERRARPMAVDNLKRNIELLLNSLFKINKSIKLDNRDCEIINYKITPWSEIGSIDNVIMSKIAPTSNEVYLVVDQGKTGPFPYKLRVLKEGVMKRLDSQDIENGGLNINVQIELEYVYGKYSDKTYANFLGLM